MHTYIHMNIPAYTCASICTWTHIYILHVMYIYKNKILTIFMWQKRRTDKIFPLGMITTDCKHILGARSSSYEYTRLFRFLNEEYTNFPNHDKTWGLLLVHKNMNFSSGVMFWNKGFTCTILWYRIDRSSS